MTDADERLRSNLRDILGNAPDPFQKEASADAQFEVATEALMEQLNQNEADDESTEAEAEQAEAPEVQKIASVSDLSLRQMYSTPQFQQGFMDAFEKRASELSDLLEEFGENIVEQARESR